VPRGEGRDDLHPPGEDRDRARRRRGAAGRRGGRRVPHPSRGGAPPARARGLRRARSVDARAGRRRAERRPPQARRSLSSRFTESTWLKEEQYRDASNLRARIELHRRFDTNPEPWHRWVFDRLDFPAEADILEVGCGPAELWRQNLDRIPAGWRL